MPRVVCFAVLLLMHSASVFSSDRPLTRDWLVEDIHKPVQAELSQDGKELTLTNGLISRTFLIEPGLATIGYKNLSDGSEFVRGVKPEAVIGIDGRSFDVGGLLGQPDYAFLDPSWLTEMTPNPDAFQCTGWSEGEPEARFAWKRKRYSADMPWPPPGKTVTFEFEPPESLRQTCEGLTLAVHYEMTQGLPLLTKWITVHNGSDRDITIDSLTTEVLAVVERHSEVQRIRSVKPRQYMNHIDPNDMAEMSQLRIHVQSDYAFCGMSIQSSDQTTFWAPDEQYVSQVNYSRIWPHLLTSKYPYGPGAVLKPGGDFESFRTFELLHDSDDRERRGLAIRRMHRTLAPWCTENPVLMHVRQSDSESIRRAVDQCAEVGFEMVILSFGSGADMESEDEDYIARIKADFDYAHGKGIEIGSYSLLASRSAGAEYDVIDPSTGKPGAYYGNSPCLVSEWGGRYFERLKNFIAKTGCDILEHDGSYPGDPCASTEHKGHAGLTDSQWAQHKRISEFYQWCRANGVYLNVPDYYFMNGSNKVAMGYRETNWSLPRALQIVLGRQNMFDGTWEKTPSMGWMFVPLVEYHGGGAAATLEPLGEHLDAYEAILAQNFGAGVQACYRGPRLYDTDATKAVVRRWVSFYKKYRNILDSDIIHVRRPDGRDIDCILHVNPNASPRGLAMVYNPTHRDIQRNLTLPLYYTGIEETARIREWEGEPAEYTLDRRYNVQLRVSLEPRSRTWFVIE